MTNNSRDSGEQKGFTRKCGIPIVSIPSCVNSPGKHTNEEKCSPSGRVHTRRLVGTGTRSHKKQNTRVQMPNWYWHCPLTRSEEQWFCSNMTVEQRGNTSIIASLKPISTISKLQG